MRIRFKSLSSVTFFVSFMAFLGAHPVFGREIWVRDRIPQKDVTLRVEYKSGKPTQGTFDRDEMAAALKSFVSRNVALKGALTDDPILSGANVLGHHFYLDSAPKPQGPISATFFAGGYQLPATSTVLNSRKEGTLTFQPSNWMSLSEDPEIQRVPGLAKVLAAIGACRYRFAGAADLKFSNAEQGTLGFNYRIETDNCSSNLSKIAFFVFDEDQLFQYFESRGGFRQASLNNVTNLSVRYVYGTKKIVRRP